MQSCHECDIGKVSAEPNATTCLDCKAGQSSNAKGSAKCISCGAGKYSNVKGEDCKACLKGQYREVDDPNTSSCKNCGKGFYQDSEGQALCLPCLPGEFGNETGMQSCHKCDIGRVSRKPNASLCEDCDPGKSSDTEGSAKCTSCGAGKYSKITGGDCKACLKGRYRVGGDGDPKSCDACAMGFYQDSEGQASCLPCLPGEFGNETGMQSCHICDIGRVSRKPNATLCEDCDPGKSSDAIGSARCTLCAAGQFSSSVGSKCRGCPTGFYQNIPGERTCNKAANGTIVLEGRAAAVDVPLGSYIKCTTASNSDCKIEPCPAGRYGHNPPRESACKKCPAGQSSFSSSIKCSVCAKGKFAIEPGVEKCMDCPIGKFQPQDSKPSTSCKTCPEGFVQDRTGESTCLSLNWLQPEECGADQYLNNTDKDQPESWKCVSCPKGGSCSWQKTTWANLGPLFGWWKIPESQREDHWSQVFAECLYPPACPGQANPALENRYENDDGEDLAKLSSKNRSNVCDVDLGFKNYSRLCHMCRQGHRRYRVNQCARCPETGQNWGLLVLGLIVLLGLLAYVISSALRKSGRKHLHQSVKKVLINYLQVMSLARSFPLRWPESLNLLFEIQGALSTLGDHIVNMDCLNDTSSPAQLFYLKQIVYAFVPLLLALISFIGWYAYGLRRGQDFFSKRSKMEPHQFDKSPKDKFIVTISAIIFLMYPTLCYQALSLFSCTQVGKQQYLHADLEEQCYTGRHLVMLVSLGVTQILVYVIGLPLSVLLFLLRNYRIQSRKDMLRSDNPNPHHYQRNKELKEGKELKGLFQSPVVVTRWGLFFYR